jgi:branched-chain amino acid transport system permease protein
MSGSASRRWIPWVAGAAVFLVLPAVFGSGFPLAIYAEAAIMIVLALSYNLLLGTTGMLSFGHAVYSGFGAYAAIHALNWIGRSHPPLSVSLLPLVGGLGGLAGGAVLGFLSTRRSGTAFAMITLGLSELIGACWLMFPSFFGGEGGIPGNRTAGGNLFGVAGWNLGSDLQVSYLLGAWCFASIVAMRALLATPLGRIANAVRDNPERAEFVGYSARQVRWLMLMASSFFAGIGGALAAINFEIVTAENVGAARSGEMLLATFIGGAGYFHGPIIGAVVFVFFAVALSQFSKAWQLYLGLFFLVLVLKAPGGLADVAARSLRQLRDGSLRRRAGTLLPLALCLAAALAGMILLVEMTYQRTLDPTASTQMRIFWTPVDAGRPGAWVLSLVLAAGGLALALWLRRREALASPRPYTGPSKAWWR